MKKYDKTFTFVDTEAEAKRFCDVENTKGSYYKRKNKKSHYTPWHSSNGKEHKFICWYYN